MCAILCYILYILWFGYMSISSLPDTSGSQYYCGNVYDIRQVEDSNCPPGGTGQGVTRLSTGNYQAIHRTYGKCQM